MTEFDVILQATERGIVRLVLPFDPNEQWGRRRNLYVRGTLNGITFEAAVEDRHGVAFVPVSRELRVQAEAAVGDRVHVVLEPKDP
jgi:hypothetical protein